MGMYWRGVLYNRGFTSSISVVMQTVIYKRCAAAIVMTICLGRLAWIGLLAWWYWEL